MQDDTTTDIEQLIPQVVAMKKLSTSCKALAWQSGEVNNIDGNIDTTQDLVLRATILEEDLVCLSKLLLSATERQGVPVPDIGTSEANRQQAITLIGDIKRVFTSAEVDRAGGRPC